MSLPGIFVCFCFSCSDVFGLMCLTQVFLENEVGGCFKHFISGECFTAARLIQTGISQLLAHCCVL